MKNTTIEDWGIIAYADAWKRQTEWFDALVEAKRNQQPYTNKIVMCQHPPVYTLGRSGKETNMLMSEEQLERLGASLYHIDRGGISHSTAPDSWFATPS